MRRRVAAGGGRDGGRGRDLLRSHRERHIAFERGARGRDLDGAGDCAGGDGGLDFRVRHDGECCRRAVEADFGGAGEIVAENQNGRADAARVGSVSTNAPSPIERL